MLMFFLLLIWKRSLCIYVESFFFLIFFSKKRGVIGNPYFQWMHLSNCTNLSKITHGARKAFECTKKREKKSFNWMHSLCLFFCYLQVSFKFFVYFFFFLERICDRFFSVDYIWVLPHAFIESYVKWIKKNILQFLKSILLTWVIIS